MNKSVASLLLAAWMSIPAIQLNAQDTTVIAFGSCAREREQQTIWEEIQQQQPEIFLMIGDNQYADFQEIDGEIAMQPVTDVQRIAEAYRTLGAQSGFQEVRQSADMYATWDDHDYGANDMGNDYPLRAESQKAFIDFWGYFPPPHPIHNQEGVYHSINRVTSNGNRLQIILLDTRYHRDPIDRIPPGERNGGPYGPTSDTSKTMLGEEQWNWLERTLRLEADIRIIASSIQVVSDEHGWETWGNMPHERDRLYKLIEDTGATGVFFISGDRHLVELSRDNERGAPYPMWDFTSSGLTQQTEPVEEQNSFRIGPVKRETNYGIIRIEWAAPVEETAIHLEGLGRGQRLLTRQTIFLSQLKGSNSEIETAALDGIQLPLVFEDDFERGEESRANWETTDDTAWENKLDESNHVFGLNRRTSDYQPDVRSPHNIALVRDLELSDFVLTFDVKSTKDTGNHRDCCVFFGHQNPAQFYYSHLGARPDPNSGQIMIVDNAPRTPLTTNENTVPWDDQWHQVKVTRNSATGEIKIYFDNMDEPIMSASDQTFVRGRLGIGSFDDMNDFDNVRIWGR
ncbi:MAG: alkaline phosphatase D family protein [Planctomycetota bacterium]